MIRKTLRRARIAIDARSQAVYLSLSGIIFLGTPHRGGSRIYLELASIARKIAVLSGFSARANVLKDLRFDSTIGRVLQEEFVQLLDAKRPNIFTFREGKGLTGFTPLSGKVRQKNFPEVDEAHRDRSLKIYHQV